MNKYSDYIMFDSMQIKHVRDPTHDACLRNIQLKPN